MHEKSWIFEIHHIAHIQKTLLGKKVFHAFSLEKVGVFIVTLASDTIDKSKSHVKACGVWCSDDRVPNVPEISPFNWDRSVYFMALQAKDLPKFWPSAKSSNVWILLGLSVLKLLKNRRFVRNSISVMVMHLPSKKRPTTAIVGVRQHGFRGLLSVLQRQMQRATVDFFWGSVGYRAYRNSERSPHTVRAVTILPNVQCIMQLPKRLFQWVEQTASYF
jgi:hypothetical protein